MNHYLKLQLFSGSRLCLLAILMIFLWMMSFCSCSEETIYSGDDIELTFSLDTLTFDTVFTEAGSATRWFKIFNPQPEAVIIESISIDQSNSFFRLNVDGVAGNQAKDIRIEAMDSIYVFAEVTIDPDMPLSISPFIIEDHVNIVAGTNNYQILLQAWGQNANYLPNRQSASRISLLSCDFGTVTWDDPKPYVIYGSLVIDSCTLVIPEGKEIYIHGGIAINDLGIYTDGILIFLKDGSLKCNGTPDNPVLFKTDRLEEDFDQVTGQWSGILFSVGSQRNELKYTHIENSVVGVSVDSTATLRMVGCQIAHTSSSAVVTAHSTVYAENCLFYDNSAYGLHLNYGGTYTFNYCTISNYDNQDQALFLNNFRCYDSDCSVIGINDTRARFNNCIFMGNGDDEIGLTNISEDNSVEFDYQFSNSIVIVDELLDADAFPNFFDRCTDCKNLTRTDSLFIDLEGFDFHLDTMSVAIDMASPINNIDFDIEDNPRTLDMPDIGCYEFQK